MKALLPFLLGSLIFSSPAQAQIYSARRLTERIAPQPAPTTRPGPAPAAPAYRVAAPVVRPAALPARSTYVEAERPANGTNQETEALSSENGPAPLVVACPRVQPDPNESLQTVPLSLSNTVSKVIQRATIRLGYYGEDGQRLKEWTTRTDLNPNLQAKSAMEVVQPAYFMPFLTRRVKIDVLSVTFADGSQWCAR